MNIKNWHSQNGMSKLDATEFEDYIHEAECSVLEERDMTQCSSGRYCAIEMAKYYNIDKDEREGYE